MKSQESSAILLLLLLAFVAGAAAQACGCSNSTATEFTCDDPSLAEVPACVPSYITNLAIINNSIPITASTFSRFTNLTTLTIADLTQLTSLPEDVFSGNSELQYLFVYNTQITGLPANVFLFNTQLQGIGIYRNKITSLEASTFSNTPNLIEVGFSDNLVTSVSADTFTNTKLQIIWLGNNPWHCDCTLLAFQLWLNSIEIKFEGVAQCETPSELQGTLLTDLPGILQCF